MIVRNRLGENMISYGQMNLLFSARNLWRDLTMWTRAYLVSRFAGIGTLQDVFNRLYRLPVEFGNTLRLIFGDEVADQYIQLLSNTVILFKDIIEAEIKGDEELADRTVKELYANGNERAKFFASINPFWDEVMWQNLIYEYYNYTIQEITSFLTNNANNIDIFDKLIHHSDSMGDYFSQGLFNYLISKQGNSSPK